MERRPPAVAGGAAVPFLGEAVQANLAMVDAELGFSDTSELIFCDTSICTSCLRYDPYIFVESFEEESMAEIASFCQSYTTKIKVKENDYLREFQFYLPDGLYLHEVNVYVLVDETC
ncbi:hypothetical protein L1987_69111 [Smallanthus sonchifolius]|uniref:Uncharacterized protein n=1 Tax=Smallanthus sonchifolius TaxID=185202 RepID=A0ACB9B4R5_9ASTR|nr:hypothetical protein L1987_69111 [Smallanthus sonchifolius]